MTDSAGWQKATPLAILIVLCGVVALYEPRLVPLTLAGALAAFINVVAGGGSLILIPALTFVGGSAAMTNGTIRLYILFQGLVALWSYRKSGLFDKRMFKAAPFVIGGAALGVLFITKRPDDDVRLLLGIAVLLAAVFTVRSPSVGKPKHLLWICLGAALSGFYGGMVQAGTGYLFLTTATWLAGMELARANLTKIVWATSYAPLTIFLFHRAGQIDWPMAIAIAIGAMPGAYLGSKPAISGGKRFLTWAVIASAIIGGAFLILGK